MPIKINTRDYLFKEKKNRKSKWFSGFDEQIFLLFDHIVQPGTNAFKILTFNNTKFNVTFSLVTHCCVFVFLIEELVYSLN